MKYKIILITIILTIFSLAPVWAIADKMPSKPGQKDKCPVCGMFVYKYPNWVSAVVLKDGKTFYYDGAKDMFRHLPEIGSPVAKIWVTEYYGLTMVDARTAFYVLGSDVYGPMGHELIPFATRADADEFMGDHKGKRILTFDEVDAKVLKGLK